LYKTRGQFVIFCVSGSIAPIPLFKRQSIGRYDDIASLGEFRSVCLICIAFQSDNFALSQMKLARMQADMLFLFEKPGPMTSAAGKGSGFISRNNDDPTAEATFRFMTQADLPRNRTILWNVVPGWNKTRKITARELSEGVAALKGLLPLIPKLRTIILVGQKAQRAKPLVGLGLKIFVSAMRFHPPRLLTVPAPRGGPLLRGQHTPRLHARINGRISGVFGMKLRVARAILPARPEFAASAVARSPAALPAYSEGMASWSAPALGSRPAGSRAAPYC
jgi:hypothetical protein